MATEFSPEGLRYFSEKINRDPADRMFNELLVANAERQGGLTFGYWKALMGPLWGEPRCLTFDECVRELNVPATELRRVAEETDRAVRDEFRRRMQGRPPKN